jgi:hypothetical protein
MEHAGARESLHVSKHEQHRECPPRHRREVPREAERTRHECGTAEELRDDASCEEACEYVALTEIRVRATGQEDDCSGDEKHVCWCGRGLRGVSLRVMERLRRVRL